MYCNDPGHDYSLPMLDGIKSKTMSQVQRLSFVKREGEKYPGNVGEHPGVTTQEVLRALIDRARYVDGQVHDDLNEDVIEHLRQALYLLEVRAHRRRGRALPFRRWRSGSDADTPNAIRHDIELEPACLKCGHIRCEEPHA